MATEQPGCVPVVKETSTLDSGRPTILEEKRRIERELGLPVEPAIVMPKGSTTARGKPSLGARFRAFFRGAPPGA